MNFGLKHWIGGVLMSAIVIFGAIAFYSPADSARLAVVTGRGAGMGAGSTAGGLAAVPGGFRQTYGLGNAMPTVTVPGNQPQTQQAPQQQTAQEKENAALKKKLAQQDRAIKALEKAQKAK